MQPTTLTFEQQQQNREKKKKETTQGGISLHRLLCHIIILYCLLIDDD